VTVSGFPPWVWHIPEFFNIGVACTDAHLDTPVASRVAVVVDDEATGVRQLTFAELAERTSRFAEVLRELGVGAGDRVLIRLPNCLEYPVVFLGAMKRGAIPVPTSTLLTAEEVLYLATDSGATAMVTDRATWNAMHEALDGLGTLAHVLLAGRGDAAAARRVHLADLDGALAGMTRTGRPHLTRAEDPAYLVYTSGTTGYPKGVLHAHRALLGRQPSSTYWFDFRPEGDRVLHAGKFNWTYVLGTGLMDPLYRGHTAMVHEGGPDAAKWPHLIARHAATIFIGVPTIYRQILQKTRFGRADVPTLRHCMSAGEHLSDEVLAGWRERFGLAVYEGLGMTECSYYLCQTRSRAVRPGSAGFAQPGHDVRLLDPTTWREVAPDEEGMLCIPRDDPGLMLGYWRKPEETAAVFHGDWYLTGDYARRDADGYVWFLGRRDDLIKSFGYRVSPHEVERVLKDHPDVADAAAVGEEVSRDKVLVVAYVVLRPGSGLTATDVLAYARERLASYKTPRVAYLVDELPRTPNGKLLRRALAPERARARASDRD
jgi:acyl-coenzyme A synthetase/AMP-(fatty) acid ligase